MSRQSWAEAVFWADADGTAVTNTTTETIIFPNVTVAGGYMHAQRVLRATLRGRYANVVTAVPTFTFRTRWGGVAGTVLLASPAIVTSVTAMTASMWKMAYEIQSRTNGATGNLFAEGDVTMFTGTAATFGTVTNYGVVQPMGSAGVITPAQVAVDQTVDQALADTIQQSAASASNSLTGHLKVLESLN